MIKSNMFLSFYVSSCFYFFITEMSKENDLQMQQNVLLKECNAMYSYRFESIWSFSTPVNKRPNFSLKINNREGGRGGGGGLGRLEKEFLRWKNFEKLTIGGGQLIGTREYKGITKN